MVANELQQVFGGCLPISDLRPARASVQFVGERGQRHDLAGPTAVDEAVVVIDEATAETVGKNSRGYDGAKKINGRKRHLVVDTKGLPLFVMVTPADMTDREAAKESCSGCG